MQAYIQTKESTGGLVICPMVGGSDKVEWGVSISLLKLNITSVNRAEAAMLLIALRLAQLSDTDIEILSDCKSVVDFMCNIEDNEAKIRKCKIPSDLWLEMVEIKRTLNHVPVIKHVMGHPDKNFGDMKSETYWNRFDLLEENDKLIVKADYLASHFKKNARNFQLNLGVIFCVRNFLPPDGIYLVKRDGKILQQKKIKDILGLFAEQRWQVYLETRKKNPQNRGLAWDDLNWPLLMTRLIARSRGLWRMDSMNLFIKVIDWGPTFTNMVKRGYKLELYGGKNDPMASMCKGCLQEVETMDHLICDCPSYGKERKSWEKELTAQVSKLGANPIEILALVKAQPGGDKLRYWSWVGLLPLSLTVEMQRCLRSVSKPLEVLKKIVDCGLELLEAIFRERKLVNKNYLLRK